MSNLYSKVLLGVLAAALSLSARAGPQWCIGKVANLTMYSSGVVYLNPTWEGFTPNINYYPPICNMNVETNGVSVLTCATWLAVLKNALQRQSRVQFYYADAPACDTIPYNGPYPTYIMQIN